MAGLGYDRFRKWRNGPAAGLSQQQKQAVQKMREMSPEERTARAQRQYDAQIEAIMESMR
jgi:hypothetical protein